MNREDLIIDHHARENDPIAEAPDTVAGALATPAMTGVTVGAESHVPEKITGTIVAPTVMRSLGAEIGQGTENALGIPPVTGKGLHMIIGIIVTTDQGTTAMITGILGGILEIMRIATRVVICIGFVG